MTIAYGPAYALEYANDNLYAPAQVRTCGHCKGGTMESMAEEVLKRFCERVRDGWFLYIPKKTKERFFWGKLDGMAFGDHREINPNFADTVMDGTQLWALFKRIEAGEKARCYDLIGYADLEDPAAWKVITTSLKLHGKPVLRDFPGGGVARFHSFKIFVGHRLADGIFKEARGRHGWFIVAEVQDHTNVTRLRRLLVEDVWKGMTPLEVVRRASKRKVEEHFGGRRGILSLLRPRPTRSA